MMNRREFIRLSTIALSTLAGGMLVDSPAQRPLGVQLYTVRDQAGHDLQGVLAAIQQIGYKEVELYWDSYDHPAPALRRMIEDHHLRAPSGHFNYEGLASKLDYAQALGLEYVICPMLPRESSNTLDGFKRAADQFNRWGEEVHRRGMRFGFHNHNYEFRKFGNITGFETLLEHTDPKLVALEMDCYWITQAGENPLEMFKKYGSRIAMLHLKDRKSGFPSSQTLDETAEHFTEVGSGTIDWRAILLEAKKNQVRHLFVEQDTGEHPPLDSLRISYKNLQSLL
ncbi:MAG TPA: sugar phosphate isomerase/epimerase [Candidatus Angelobacter sp.]|nr:sugar phosphate isomerase/epimerase [Candidatus Angelobacter sp.]